MHFHASLATPDKVSCHCEELATRQSSWGGVRGSSAVSITEAGLPRFARNDENGMHFRASLFTPDKVSCHCEELATRQSSWGGVRGSSAVSITETGLPRFARNDENGMHFHVSLATPDKVSCHCEELATRQSSWGGVRGSSAVSITEAGLPRFARNDENGMHFHASLAMTGIGWGIASRRLQ